MNVKLTAAQKIRVLNSLDVYGIMQRVLLREKKIDRNKEHFWIVCLDTRNRILMIELISLGTVDTTLAEPMEIFSFALQKRAVKIILVHNHPSGYVQPSEADKELTDKMMAIGKFIKVPVIDHLVISETDYFSFEDTGLLKNIARLSHFDLTFANIERFRNEIERNKKEAARKVEQAEAKRSIEIAKNMLKKKEPLTKILEFTGLTKKQVEGLKGK